MSGFEVGESYYTVLDVPPTAEHSEIQKAWVKKTKEVHADKTGESDKYEYLLDAGVVLKDEKKRQAYDTLGHEVFVDRYGRRGNQEEINPADLNPATANIPSETDTASDDDSSTTSTTSSTNSTTTNSGKTTGNAANSSDTTTGYSESTQTSTEETRSQSSTETSSESSSKSRTNTRTNRSTRNRSQNQTRTRTRTRTKNRTNTRAQAETDTNTNTETKTNTAGEEDDRDQSSTGVKALVGRVLEMLFILPSVRYPVTTRVVGVGLALLAVLGVSSEIGVMGTGVDLIGMFGASAIALLWIRWGPDYFGAIYPRESKYLSQVPPVGVAVMMIGATAVGIAGEFPLTEMFKYSLVISAYLFGVMLAFAAVFGLIGVGLAVIAWITGSRGRLKSTVSWSALLGSVIAFSLLVTTVGKPKQSVLLHGAGLTEYPWSAVNGLPENVVHVPMVATFLLAAFVTIGAIGGVILTVLVLYHAPQRHAHQGWFIRPTLWEIGASSVAVTAIWMVLYDAPQNAEVIAPYVTSHVVTESGLLEFIWGPVLVLMTAFAIRDVVEPRYSEWRRN